MRVATELFEAVRGADAGAPAALETFDWIVASREPRPDFYEYSVRVAERVSPHRFTYYFDTYRRGGGVAREAGERFVELAGALGLALPSALSEFVRSDAPCGSEVLQVVLGVDAAVDGTRTRGKYYLVFRDNPAQCVSQLLRMAGLTPPRGTDPGKVYIVGIDVMAAGVDDVKLYFRLEPSLLGRVIDNAAELGDLLAATRDVVFQQCTRRPDRRQVYLHARSSASLSEWLARNRLGEPLERARLINAKLQGSRIDPWIVSFSHGQRRVDVGASNVYFHLTRQPAARET